MGARMRGGVPKDPESLRSLTKSMSGPIESKHLNFDLINSNN